MDQLSLPAFDIRLKQTAGETFVFDQIRKKFIVLTPEEWVRQHFINYLVTVLDYPKALITVEQGLRYNSLLKRSDIVVFSREGKPIVLVECKAAKYNLSPKVVEQALVYNRTVGANHIIVTNGLESACMFIQKETARIEYLSEIPQYSDLT